MLRLDQDSDQTVSFNWRRVASTHSFQVRAFWSAACDAFALTTKAFRAVTQELLCDNQAQPEQYKAATAIWGYAAYTHRT